MCVCRRTSIAETIIEIPRAQQGLGASLFSFLEASGLGASGIRQLINSLLHKTAPNWRHFSRGEQCNSTQCNQLNHSAPAPKWRSNDGRFCPPPTSRLLFTFPTSPSSLFYCHSSRNSACLHLSIRPNLLPPSQSRLQWRTRPQFQQLCACLVTGS